jgi:tetratricopeptide (TPR) repeat protein
MHNKYNVTQERYIDAIDECTSAIELDNEYVKARIKTRTPYMSILISQAYYRRGQCREQNKDTYDDALKDYERVVELQPSNIDARQACQVS